LNGHDYTATMASNAWTATVPQGDVAALLDGSHYTVTADVSDQAGNPAVEASHTLAVDETAPTISIATIAADDVINAQEAQSDLAISGTTSGAEDGQLVTVHLNGPHSPATGAPNAWTATVPQGDVAALLDGSHYTVTADVSDQAGNPAVEASHTLAVDETAPTISIATIAADDVINAQEAQSDLAISGTTSGA